MNAIHVCTISIKELHQGQVSKGNTKNIILHVIFTSLWFCDNKFSFEGLHHFKVNVKFNLISRSYSGQMTKSIFVFPGLLPPLYYLNSVHLAQEINFFN